MPAKRASFEFGGTERFALEGRLGEGGMGIVYRARDRESSQSVALKTVGNIEPSALLRFKNEFRALSDISHPNVVQLYEMASAGEHWFFTMELLDGVDFRSWVRPLAQDSPAGLPRFALPSSASFPMNRTLTSRAFPRRPLPARG